MTIKKCVQYGRTFILTDSEIKFYQDKGLSIPKRCEDCREKNKEESKAKTKVNTSKNEGLATQFRKHPIITLLAIIILSVLGISFNDITQIADNNTSAIEQSQTLAYTFRNETYLTDHFNKHKDEFSYNNASEYLEGANAVIQAKNVLHKVEAEDGDDVYYLEKTNELVIVSTDGYIRTYFKPSDGIAYFNRQ